MWEKIKKTIQPAENQDLVGWYFGPVWFNLAFRPFASAVAGIIISTLLWLPLAALALFGVIPSNPLNPALWLLLTVALAIWIALPDNETPEKVPEAHAAMVTFLGARLRVYRTEGEYSWTGKRLFLGRSAKVSMPGTDKKEGFIYLGDIPIRIWNAADEKEKVVITCVSRDSTAVKTTLTVTFKLNDPYLWVNSEDALGDVAERARSALRSAVNFFVGTDVAGVKSVLGHLMSEQTIVTAFLKKPVGTNVIHSMLQDHAGVPQYIIVGKEEDPNNPGKMIEIEGETIDQAKQRFLTMLNSRKAEFSTEMWEAATDQSNQHIVATDRSVSETLNEVAEKVGADFLRASIGDISLPPKVVEEAEKAASEIFQRDAQVASARAIRQAREELKPSNDDLNDPYFQDAAMVAAAQDNPNISVVHVTGSGDRLTRAAAVHASQTKKGK